MKRPKLFGLRLAPELATQIDADARSVGLSATEWLRLIVVRHYARLEPDLQRDLLYEIAKTRAVLLRLIDRQHGEQLADEILTVAGTDAELYLQRKRSD
jgi:hypothetical protein